MSYYVWGSNYQNYLQQKSFSDDEVRATKKVALEVSKQTRELIASREDLKLQNIEIRDSLERMTSEISDDINKGFESLSYNLMDITAGISDLSAQFHWGFSELIAEFSHMADSLKELIKIAKTPTQTAAYEHFEIARDMYRKGLYAESLEELNKVINGVPGVSSDYKYEWRVHQLIGVIRLGFADCDLNLVNLEEAENAFINAGKYAKADYPQNAAIAYLSAGWAAYCQGKFSEALTYTESAMKLKPDFGEAIFQSAKILAAQNNIEHAFPMLRKAIDLDLFYSIKALGDGDFKKHEAGLNQFFSAMIEEKYNNLNKRMSEYFASKDKGKLPKDIEKHISTVVNDKKLLDYREAEIRWHRLRFRIGRYLEALDEYLKEEKALLELFYSKIKGYLKDYKGYEEVLNQLNEQFFHLSSNQEDVLEQIKETLYKSARELPLKIEKEREVYYNEKVIDSPKGFLRREKSHIEKRVRIEKHTVDNDERQSIFMHINGIAIEMCLVEGGTFQMGSTKGVSNEKPVHSVTVSSFYIGKYEVTQKEWQAVMGNNPSNSKGDNKPVESITWYQAVEFCNKLSQKEGLTPAYTINGTSVSCNWNADGYRLPTEAEWEFAARGGKLSKGYTYSGSNNLDEVGWYSSNSDDT
ncbi:MAG TPA: SUMF1/EgtB/PvdO family nonheme iron enzyme, partial [Candidatus Cloacimonadota bacterium]|nr:SUMF1/EgtB/PvdO family nonheme iron enzyme [Candidatus Cloacimonadota bacterium]